MSDDNRDELEALGLNYIGSGSRPHVTDSVTNAYSDAPDDPDTIRTRLEAIRDLLLPDDLDEVVPCTSKQPHKWTDDHWDEGVQVCDHCGLNKQPLSAVDEMALEHAVAALELLDAADRASTWLNGENVEDLRLVPDPERDAK